jgi:SAM-dependent methyltransferase
MMNTYVIICKRELEATLYNMRQIVKDGYEKGDYVDTYRTGGAPTKMEREYLEKFTALVPESGKVLDLGCGSGIPFDKYLTEKGLLVTGVDIAGKHIEMARRNVPRATYIEGDFTALDFDASKFDGIVAFYSIFHIPKSEHEILFSKMASLLESNGIVLMTLGTHTGDVIDGNWCGTAMAWSSYDPETYKGLINACGFEIIADSYEGQPEDQEYHWWVLMKKRT